MWKDLRCKQPQMWLETTRHNSISISLIHKIRELEIRLNSISLSFAIKGAGIAAATGEEKNTSKAKQAGSQRGSRKRRSGCSSRSSAGVSSSSSSAAFCFSFSWLSIAKNDAYIYIYIYICYNLKVLKSNAF